MLFSPLSLQGNFAFDAGANIGIFSLLAFNQGATVVAFEPSVDTFRRLNTNIRVNRAD